MLHMYIALGEHQGSRWELRCQILHPVLITVATTTLLHVAAFCLRAGADAAAGVRFTPEDPDPYLFRAQPCAP